VCVLVPVGAVGFGVATLFFISRTVSAAAIPQSRKIHGPGKLADSVWNILMAAGMLALFVPLIHFA
jgi:hypothetical protein